VCEQGLDLAPVENRAVAANERPSELAVAAAADRALHVAFHAEIQARLGQAACSRLSAAARIMPSGPHIMATAHSGSKLARLNNSVTRPTCQGHNAAPSLAATNTWVSGNFAQRSYCSRQIRSSACFTPWMMTSLPKRSRRRST